ncbi:NAD(P)/FAD-dependent oxidoreductase [Nocardioides deserti]|uniref:NAD(P)/FAD-dependent oxidoreductase n=1 Tax=Nocardioides deserti TaxID=1588644 RepID=UPI001C92DB41|nr:FAD-dependent oxidoreductase [Nocardioides deserti]
MVVGASLAGIRTAEALRSAGYAGRLTIIGEEPHSPYDRPPLTKGFLTSADGHNTFPALTRAQPDVHWLLEKRAEQLDLDSRRVLLHTGESIPFDGLVIATGSAARTLTSAGRPDSRPPTANGVHLVRTLDDAIALREALRRGPRRVAVVGAGFIGTEVAASVRSLGLAVTLIGPDEAPLARAVGTQVADHVARLHRTNGVDLRMGVPVEELETVCGTVAAVRLADGVAIDADLVVLGLGTTPCTDWLSGSGLLLQDGVRADRWLRALWNDGTPVSGVVAAGDVVRWPHRLYDDSLVRVEHWSNAALQAPIAARTLLNELAGRSHAPADACAIVPTFWSDQYDSKLLSVGLPHLGTTQTLLDGDAPSGRLVVGFGRGMQMVGAVAVDQPGPLATWKRHITRGGPWPPAIQRPEDTRRDHAATQ